MPSSEDKPTWTARGGWWSYGYYAPFNGKRRYAEGAKDDYQAFATIRMLPGATVGNPVFVAALVGDFSTYAEFPDLTTARVYIEAIYALQN